MGPPERPSDDERPTHGLASGKVNDDILGPTERYAVMSPGISFHARWRWVDGGIMNMANSMHGVHDIESASPS